MFITPAYAQSAGGGGQDLLVTFFPFILVFAIIYFLIIRPPQKRAREHKEMINNVRRGDTVVTAGGLIGKVTRVGEDNELQVEIGEGVRVRVIKSTLTDVRSKSAPVPAASNDDTEKKS